jgi:hypothetical protein
LVTAGLLEELWGAGAGGADHDVRDGRLFGGGCLAVVGRLWGVDWSCVLVRRSHPHLVDGFHATHFADFVKVKVQACFHGLMYHPNQRDVTGCFGLGKHLPPSTDVGVATGKPDFVDVLVCFVLGLCHRVDVVVLVVRVGCDREFRLGVMMKTLFFSRGICHVRALGSGGVRPGTVRGWMIRDVQGFTPATAFVVCRLAQRPLLAILLINLLQLPLGWVIVFLTSLLAPVALITLVDEVLSRRKSQLV